MAQARRGRIVKGIAGFYYVHVPREGVYECRARNFRRGGQKPLVGDDVEIRVLDERERLGNISRLLPRRSQLIRPAVANIDQAMILFALARPQPNFNLLDRFLVMMGKRQIPCLICLNKRDLDGEGLGEQVQSVYRACGYETLLISVSRGEGLEEAGRLLEGKTTAVAGPSGVGKSSLINSLQSDIVMETGDVSGKIERGRHTTRHSELIALGERTYILDTPGFSSLELWDVEKEELADFYPEMALCRGRCRFTGCSHISEPDCAVKELLEQGKISPMRYESYRQLYQELKDRRRYG